jgi:hypothetical protein
MPIMPWADAGGSATGIANVHTDILTGKVAIPHRENAPPDMTLLSKS